MITEELKYAVIAVLVTIYQFIEPLKEKVSLSLTNIPSSGKCLQLIHTTQLMNV